MLIMTWSAQYGVTHLPIQSSSIIFLLEIIAGADHFFYGYLDQLAARLKQVIGMTATGDAGDR